MSKKRSQDPTDGELNYVKAECTEGETPLWIKWVTKKKRDKEQDRLIVVSAHRIFSIKKTLTGKKKVMRNGHLYDLKAINSPDVDRAVLQFKLFEIDVTEPGITDMITQIRLALQKITVGFPQYALPEINMLPPERGLSNLPEIDAGPAYGMIPTYVAYCDLHKSEQSPEFIKFIKDTVTQKSTDLKLHYCPGIDRKENPIDLIPIRAALRHNTYFCSFQWKNIPRKDLAMLISDSLTHNVTLDKLVLSGCDSEADGIAAIGSALKKNIHNRISYIDFSNSSSMKDKGCIGLADGLMSFNHGLNSLNLALCGIGNKGISQLMQSLSLGREVGKTMTELDISHNSVGVQGSSQLGVFFSQELCANGLRSLRMENTGADLTVVCKAIALGKICSLEELQFSKNKIDSQAGQAISILAETNPYLKMVNLSHCEIQHGTTMSILSSISSNTSIQDVCINLSGNELGIQGAQSIASILAGSSNIGALILVDCKFKKEGLQHLVESLATNTSLKCLDLSLNFNSGKVERMNKLMQSLAAAVSSHPTLYHLAVQGDGNKKMIGDSLTALVNCLSLNPVLNELDITGNKMGDTVAVSLCDNLEKNTNLKCLYWDRNNVTISGWQALKNLLNANQNLQLCPLPKHDQDKAINAAKNKEIFKERLAELFKEIEEALKKNRNGTDYVSPWQSLKVSKTSLQVEGSDNYRMSMAVSPLRPQVFFNLKST
eukprot:TRINITY_DN3569_c0_g1_i1.p1 TRINITY_DN3569_c0_g1~~TRINITY_DN3569_c0_g1_i1.p1  ORF type:complete len:717 (-),score=214.30 TRINITY_DN3569_c0_g1_i1:154-2304(-)